MLNLFELVILLKKIVTLVGRTQPSGPLCPWQCFINLVQIDRSYRPSL